MKDGNLTVLDAKETRKVMQPALSPQSRQSSPAWQLVVASVVAYRNLLPEAL
jgi:hypothetical protein